MIKDVSFIIQGARYDALPDASYTLEFENGTAARLPTLAKEHVDRIVGQDARALEAVPLHEVVSFLYNVGQNWRSSEYVRRKLYVRELVNFLGYSEKMADLEANWISMILSSHATLYDIVGAELGSRHILDSWVQREEAEVRAYPRGVTLHSLAGNVPLSGLVSIVRALITKNVVVVKSSSRDPFTPVAIARSFLDVDPTHPVSRAVSVVNWRGGQEGALEKRLARAADVICAWGGQEAIAWAAGNVTEKTDVLKFGPKRSLAFIARDANLREVARSLAHDVCHYDQRACFSVQQAFLEVDPEAFMPHLLEALDVYKRVLPKGYHSFDEEAARTLADREAAFLGLRAHADPDGSWAVVACTPDFVGYHPLGRTIFLHKVDGIEDVLPHVDESVQTFAIAPWGGVRACRDALASRGVGRLVELGMNNIFRSGTAHDGVFPLQRLVRYASTELPSAHYTKTMTIRIDQTTFLENERFEEFIP
jgi:long-chain-fatty-acyl-CoA reductase